MSKQTAVEWLVEQMKLDELFNADYFIQQAKQMEKEQIKEAFDNGNEQGYLCEGGKQYYNETYKKEEKC
jgi:hypothetical protein